MKWQNIDTAPRDGTWILGFGMAYSELTERGLWFTHDPNMPRVPFMMIIRWIEGWYDKEIDNGDGTYHKERALGYSYWAPESRGFQATHWMPLPAPPQEGENK